MAQYKYVATNKLNEKKRGYAVANDEEELAVLLAKQDLYLVSAKRYSDKSPSSFFTGTGKVTISEITIFCRQYAIMLNAGISLLGGLDVLQNQNFSSYFRHILMIVYEDVKGGMMLSDALGKHKKALPEFFLSMIKVGERSGKLDTVMTSLANYYEKDSKIRNNTKAAFAYPIFLLVLMVAVVVLMLLYIVPTFRESLSSLDVPIEGLTKVIYDMADFMLAYWAYVLLGAIAIVLAIILFGKTKKGRYFYDWIKVRIPGFKKINVDLITARFARGFGLLLSSGMDVNDALDAVVELLGNKDMEKRFKLATEDVRHGIPMFMSFEKYKLFPPIMLQMIAVGEKTASLDEVLWRSSAFYDDLIEASMNSLVAKIQPIMLAIMGGVIGVMFIGVYSPMISIMENLI